MLVVESSARSVTGVNQLMLTGQLSACEPLRYTPAGVPICQGTVDHESSQVEAGHERSVRLSVAVRFSGVLAEQVAKESLGCHLQLRGFIAPKRMFRDGKSSAVIQMHVTAYNLLSSS